MSRPRPAPEVDCAACGDPYRQHAGGGRCRARDGDGHCPCLGFRWVDPAGPAVGSYREPPQRL